MGHFIQNCDYCSYTFKVRGILRNASVCLTGGHKLLADANRDDKVHGKVTQGGKDYTVVYV